MSRCLTIVAAFAIGISTPAWAGTDADGRATAGVRYDDLDLSTRAGQDDLELRVKRAARAVCRVGGTGLAVWTQEAKCFRLAMMSSQKQMAQVVNNARQRS